MADIRLGNNNTVYKVGSGDCTIYLGTTLLYSGDTPTPPTPPHDYLTFTATESGASFKFSGNSISYSLDSGSTWTELASNTDSPRINEGDKILWKATLTPSTSGIGRFSSNRQFDVEGNAMSLLYGDNFVGEDDLTGKNYAFRNLFSGCTGVTSAENLSLPATTLASYCYQRMFASCTSLTTAPALPATTLTDYCYHNMFADCKSLTVAPELPATTLANNCYQRMFYNCTSLNYIKCLATNISASNCTNAWVSGVQTNNGTFTKAASMTSWTTGNNGIPSNWTVVDYTG